MSATCARCDRPAPGFGRRPDEPDLLPLCREHAAEARGLWREHDRRAAAAVSGFERVDVRPDTPEWIQERRQSLGASDVPAVLGLSTYATPLDVYYAKHGVDRDMDPELAFIGHAEELTIGRWLRRFHGELGVLRRGFMARSIEAPWLHASFDRFVVKRGQWLPVQMKTAHQYAGADWADGVPLAVQAQVQAEQYVHGSPHGYAVGFVGGRAFHLHRVDRDEDFIHQLLLPQGERFWREHVLAQVPPDPTSTAEAVSLWPGDTDADPLTADNELLELVDRLRDAKDYLDGATAAVEDLRLEIQKRMEDRTELVGPDGSTLATWRPRRASEYTVHRSAGRTFKLKEVSA